MCDAARLSHSTVTTNSTEQCYESLVAAQAGFFAGSVRVRLNLIPSLSMAAPRQREEVTVRLREREAGQSKHMGCNNGERLWDPPALNGQCMSFVCCQGRMMKSWHVSTP